jgi:hypothetical protein
MKWQLMKKKSFSFFSPVPKKKYGNEIFYVTIIVLITFRIPVASPQKDRFSRRTRIPALGKQILQKKGAVGHFRYNFPASACQRSASKIIQYGNA